MIKNNKYLETVVFCFSPVPIYKRGGGRRIKFRFWTHIYKELQQN